METNDFIKQLNEEEKRLLETLDAIRKLKEHYNININVSYNDIKNDNKDVPTVFNESLTIPQKICFALNVIGRGKSRDVAEELVKLDTSYPIDKALGDCRFHLSKLYKNGKGNIVGARKGKGKGYIYYIKE
jgi:hypothetical protein